MSEPEEKSVFDQRSLVDLVPPVKTIAEKLQVDHATAKRIYLRMIASHAGLVHAASISHQASYDADQAVMDSAATMEAQGDLVNSNTGTRDSMDELSDKQSGVQTFIWGLPKVFMIFHVATVRGMLYGFLTSLPTVTEAARDLKPSEVFSLVDALMLAIEKRRGDKID